MEQGRNEVRVMTVHGAKGLEAPIVFLPDTCSTRSARRPNGLLRLDDAERPSGRAAAVPVAGQGHQQGRRRAAGEGAMARAAETEERNRLLYVALTRARDRLYVAGFEGPQPPPANCWYQLIKDGLGGELQEVAEPRRPRSVAPRSEQTAKPSSPKVRRAAQPGAVPLPDWAKRPAPPEPLLTDAAGPSRLAPLETEAEGEPVERRAGRYAEPPIAGADRRWPRTAASCAAR